MAITIKNSAPRKTRAIDPSVLRSETLIINRDGTIQDANRVLNLGFCGDESVTQINISLSWDSNYTVFNNYDPKLVFVPQSNPTNRFTANVSRDGSCLIPRRVTNTSGNYLIYFLLQERMDQDTTNSSVIGAKDEPLYREIFVSAGIKGLVQANSIYTKLYDSESDNVIHLKDLIYNYDDVQLTLDDASWEQDIDDNLKYTTSIYLGGCTATTTDEIEITVPEGVEIKEQSYNATEKFLSITVTIPDALNPYILESISIIYPVDFEIGDGTPLKSPIEVQHLHTDATGKTTEVAISSTLLGMHMDSYVTPIQAAGLHDLSNNDTKYVIFWRAEDNSSIYVCAEQEDGNFWIPVGVTHTSGNWNLIFAAEEFDTSNKLIRAYFTPTLVAEVKDNELIADDVTNDTILVPIVVAVDGGGLAYLWDKNDYQLYAEPIGEGNRAELEYTSNQINEYLGWIGENHVAVNNIVQGFDKITQDVEMLTTEVDGLKNSVNDLSTTDSELDGKIAEVNADLQTNVANLQSQINAFAETDVGDLIDRMETAEDDIDNLQTRVNSAETQINNHTNTISSHTQTINSHTQSINNLTPRMTKAEEDIERNSRNIFTNTAEISSHNVRISTLEEKQEQTNIKLVDLQSAIDSKHETTKLLIGVEADAREEADRELQTQINTLVADLTSEVSRSTTADEQHTADIETINTNINTINTNIDAIETSLNGLQTQHNSLKNTVSAQQTIIERHDISIEGLNSTAVRNNYTIDIATPFVAKIVFLSSEADYQALVDAGTIETNTLYLIQEEEE